MIKLLRKTFAMRPPRALRIRLLRWMAASAVREFPIPIGIGALLAIGLLAWLRALEGWLGILLAAGLALFALVLAGFAWQALRSAGGVRDALAELEPSMTRTARAFPPAI